MTFSSYSDSLRIITDLSCSLHELVMIIKSNIMIEAKRFLILSTTRYRIINIHDYPLMISLFGRDCVFLEDLCNSFKAVSSGLFIESKSLRATCVYIIVVSGFE